jgi:uncharacterized protein (TIGR01777 family)
MRIAICGATGFVGRSLVARLVARGDEVIVLSRDLGVAQRSFGHEVKALAWSLDRGTVRDAWEQAVREATAVVNLSGAGILDRPWTDARRKELCESRVDVTRALAVAMADGAPGTRASSVLVSASAVGIYGMREDDATMTESSPPGSDFLADLCVRWEEAAGPARDAGIRVVHPRLGIVLGRGGGALREMVKPFKLHAGGPLGSGKQWISWVHERDVVQALELALTSPVLSGAYNLVAPNPVTMNEEAEAIATVLGTHALVRVPAFALRVILGAARAQVVLTGQRASASRLVAAGYPFAFPNIGLALRDLLVDG